MRWMPLILVAAACDPSSAEEKDDVATQESAAEATESTVYEDRDRDGYLASEDCDDLDHLVYPGAEEICDGKDNDCNDQTDEGFDADGDGAWDMVQCAHGTDCDESDPEIPAAERPYDGIDQDCDGEDLVDVDQDGFAGRSGGGNDCDDFDDSIYPNAPEIPLDDIDQDCNGLDSIDSDGDGFGAEELGGDDCNDDDDSVHPDALDWAGDDIDQDCDGEDGGLFDASDVSVTIAGTAGTHQWVGHDVVICDVDTDGRSDIVVSAPYAGAFQGAVSVFYGRNADDWESQMSMEQAGTYILSTGSGWGFGVACADVNGDGRDDLIIGQAEIQFGPHVSDYAVNIIYGVGGMLPGLLDERDADAVLSVDLGAPGGVGELQGGTLSAADVSGDGMAEIIVDHDEGNTEYGESAIWVIAGDDYRGEYALDELAFAVISDFHGDTVTGLAGDGHRYVVGQGRHRPDHSIDSVEELDGFTQGGQVSVMGLLAGEYDSVASAAELSMTGSGDAQLGAAVAVGDYDDDGSTDLAMGAPAQDGVGALYVVSNYRSLLGSDAVLDPDDEASVRLNGTVGGLGVGVSITADMTGDGVPDMLVAESEVASVGVVWVVSGALLTDGEHSIDDVAVLGIRAQYHAEQIGRHLGAADFDGDGLADPVIGSSHHPTPADVGLAMSGRVSILLSGSI